MPRTLFDRLWDDHLIADLDAATGLPRGDRRQAESRAGRAARPRHFHRGAFAHVSYPATLLFRITATMHDALAALRRHAIGLEPMTPDRTADASRQVLDDALELKRWQASESGAQASTNSSGAS